MYFLYLFIFWYGIYSLIYIFTNSCGLILSLAELNAEKSARQKLGKVLKLHGKNVWRVEAWRMSSNAYKKGDELFVSLSPPCVVLCSAASRLFWIFCPVPSSSSVAWFDLLVRFTSTVSRIVSTLPFPPSHRLVLRSSPRAYRRTPWRRCRLFVEQRETSTRKYFRGGVMQLE